MQFGAAENVRPCSWKEERYYSLASISTRHAMYQSISAHRLCWSEKSSRGIAFRDQMVLIGKPMVQSSASGEGAGRHQCIVFPLIVNTNKVCGSFTTVVGFLAVAARVRGHPIVLPFLKKIHYCRLIPVIQSRASTQLQPVNCPKDRGTCELWDLP